MANTISEILGRNIDSVKSLKQAIKELQDSLVGLDTESQEYKTTSEQLLAAQDALKSTTRAGIEANNAAKDSVVGLEKEYKELYNTYKMLTEEQRNSDFGKNMAESLSNLSNKLNETKKEAGNFKDNIGRYAQSATEAFNGMGVSIGGLQTPMKLASDGGKNLGKVFKDLAKNPWMLALTALVAILAKAAEHIKDNEELTNRLKQAMSVFKPVLDAVSNAFDFLAGLLVKTVEGLSKVAEKVMSIIPGMKDAIKSHKDLEKATQNLTKAQREANVENSKKQAEIERLREEASATDDVIEKKKLLEEAKALQAEVDAKNVELAQEELRIMQEYADKTANSAEENEKLAAAQQKVNDAIATGERNMRQYNKQLNTVTNTTKSAGGAGKNYREEAKKLHEELIEESKTEIQKLTEKYEKEKKLLEKYHLDTSLLTKKYNKEMAQLRVSELQKSLDNFKNAYSTIANTDQKWGELYTNVNGAVAGLERELANLENGTKKRIGDIIALYAKLLTTTLNKPIGKAIDELFEHGDLSNATDFEGLLERLNYRMKETAETFPEESKKIGKAIEALNKMGADKWAEMVQDVEKATIKLETLDGVVVKTGTDAAIELANLNEKAKKLKEQLTEAYGEAAKNRIAETMREVNLAMSDADINSLWDDDVMEKLKEHNWMRLAMEREALEVELEDFKGTREQKLELQEQYYNVLSQMRDAELEAEQLQATRTLGIWDAAFDHFDAWTNSINTVISAYANVMQAEIDSGKLTERETKRKQKVLENLEKVQLAVAIAGIAANTAAGIMDVWRGYAAELPVNAQTAAATGPAAAATKAALDAKSLAAAILRTSVIAVEGGAQIAAAVGGYIAKTKSATSDMGSGGGGVAATPALIDSTPYSYTRTVQTTEEEDRLNQPIYVTVTDIEDGLGRRAQVTNESSF